MILTGVRHDEPRGLSWVVFNQSDLSSSDLDIGFYSQKSTWGASRPPEFRRRIASKLNGPTPSETKLTLAQELEAMGDKISSSMSCADIINLLERHGCKDLTVLFVPQDCTRYPVSTGGFGDVYRSRLLNNHKVAIKTMRMFESSESGKYEKRAARELYAWSKCKHPNIVELMGLVRFRDSLAMVSQWAENGTLPTYLKKNAAVDRCHINGLICSGLVYLHSKDIVHGDLKGENVLISTDGTPKLNDFGCASIQNPSLQFSQSTTGAKYSTRWAAPELLEEEITVPTFETDIYALGMTMLEIFTGNVPYPNIKKDFAVIRRVLDKKELPSRPHGVLPINSTAGNQLWDMLILCWSYQPSHRPSAKTVQQLMHSIEYHMLLPPLPSINGEGNFANEYDEDRL